MNKTIKLSDLAPLLRFEDNDILIAFGSDEREQIKIGTMNKLIDMIGAVSISGIDIVGDAFIRIWIDCDDSGNPKIDGAHYNLGGTLTRAKDGRMLIGPDLSALDIEEDE